MTSTNTFITPPTTNPTAVSTPPRSYRSAALWVVLGSVVSIVSAAVFSYLLYEDAQPCREILCGLDDAAFGLGLGYFVAAIMTIAAAAATSLMNKDDVRRVRAVLVGVALPIGFAVGTVLILAAFIR